MMRRAPGQKLPHAGSIILHGAHKAWVHGSLLVLFVSGLVWLLLHYFAVREGTFGPEPHPLEYRSLQLHGVTAYLAVFLSGSLLHGHMRRAWHLRRNRRTGVLMLSTLMLLAGSGLGLYYLSGEAIREAASWLHWGLGLLAPLLLLGHVLSGRRQRAG